MTTQSLIIGRKPNWYIYPGVTHTTSGMADQMRANTILEIVKEEFSSKFNDDMIKIFDRNRIPMYVMARQVYYFFCKKKIPKMSYSQMAKPFQQDHTTVMSGIKKVQDYIDTKDVLCYDLIVRIDKRLI